MDSSQGTPPSKRHKGKKSSKSSKSGPSIKKEATTPTKVQKKPMIQESDSEEDMALGIQAPAPLYVAPVDATPPISGGQGKVKTEKRPNGIPMAKRKAIPPQSLEATPPIRRAAPKIKSETPKVKKESATPSSLAGRKRKKSSESEDEEEEEEEEEEDESAYEEDPSSDDNDDDFKVPSAKRPKKTPPVSQRKKPAASSAKKTPASAKSKAKPAPKSVSSVKSSSANSSSAKSSSAKSSSAKSSSAKSSSAKSSSTPAARKSRVSASSKKAASSPVKTPSAARGGKKKKEEEPVRKWWEEEPLPDGIKWRNLEHKGPFFAPPYERLPAGVKLLYGGKPVQLSEKAEEAAGFFAKMLDHDYTSKDVFCNNFFQDWRKEMTKDESSLVTDFKKCDFTAIHKHYKEKSEARKAMTKEEKQVIKKENEDLLEEYGWCIIDGHKEKIGNFKIEPPGLFRGRGDHPKQGKIKRRIEAQDVIINIGKNGPIPAPPEGHSWKQVQSDNKVTWLASWTENIQGAIKYVMLSPTSKLKGEKDWAKYEIARRLKSHVDKIRAQYREDLKSKEMRIRQRAVAVYFIDKLALRAGNEKDSDESADTVGCCSLRVEHIKLHDELDGKEFVIEFDFLGKDSIRYYNRVPVDKQVFKNVRLFMKDKEGGDDLFDRLTTGLLNKHLSELMDGLTAKVFRTYNASKTLQEQLYELTVAEDILPSKMLSYNRANRAVAILCNHQRAPPKTFDQQMSNLQVKIQAKEDSIIEAKAEIKALKKESRSTKDSKVTSKLESKQKQLVRLDDQLAKLEVQATDKQENKEIALGTSKLNYLDPRISVAWSKKWEVPIEKVYNKTQRQKFAWAIDMAGEEFEF